MTHISLDREHSALGAGCWGSSHVIPDVSASSKEQNVKCASACVGDQGRENLCYSFPFYCVWVKTSLDYGYAREKEQVRSLFNWKSLWNRDCVTDRVKDHI